MPTLTPASIPPSLKARPRPCSRQAHRSQSDAHAHARLHSSSVSESAPTPLLHPLFVAHFPLLFRGCLRRFGTFADIYARLLGPSFASLQPPQPHADTAAQEVATEETWEMYRRQRVFECSNERCLVLIVLAPYRGASAKLSSCSSCKVAPYCCKEGQAADLPYHQTACASL